MSSATESRSAPAFEPGADTWTIVLTKGVTCVSFTPKETGQDVVIDLGECGIVHARFP